MTKTEIQYFRNRKQLKINYAKDWLFFLLALSWIVALKYFYLFAFALLERSQIGWFFVMLLIILSVTFIFMMSVILRAGVSQTKKNQDFDRKQLISSIENESWSIVKQQDDLILIETDASCPINSIIILIAEEKIFFNNRPKTLRPFAYLSDWRIRKRLKEILTD